MLSGQLMIQCYTTGSHTSAPILNMWPFCFHKSPSTWSGVNVNISLDNLSAASKFQKTAAPSMNQLQQGGPPAGITHSFQHPHSCNLIFSAVPFLLLTASIPHVYRFFYQPICSLFPLLVLALLISHSFDSHFAPLIY